MRQRWRLVAAVFGFVILWAGFGPVDVMAAEAAGGQDVDVMRDGPAAEPSGTSTMQNGVMILRGRPRTPPPARVEPDSGTTVHGGMRMWAVNKETGKIVSCVNRKTINVGRRRIQCVHTSIPALRN